MPTVYVYAANAYRYLHSPHLSSLPSILRYNYVAPLVCPHPPLFLVPCVLSPDDEESMAGCNLSLSLPLACRLPSRRSISRWSIEMRNLFPQQVKKKADFSSIRYCPRTWTWIFNPPVSYFHSSSQPGFLPTPQPPSLPSPQKANPRMKEKQKKE